jgi:hypothetical protein
MLIKQLNNSGKWSKGSYLQTLYDSLELPISANQLIKQSPIIENITLSPNFQLVIPKSICKQLHLPIGQQFVCFAEPTGIRLIPKDSISEHRVDS